MLWLLGYQDEKYCFLVYFGFTDSLALPSRLSHTLYLAKCVLGKELCREAFQVVRGLFPEFIGALEHLYRYFRSKRFPISASAKQPRMSYIIIAM
jgi:hypothetical protein